MNGRKIDIGIGVRIMGKNAGIVFVGIASLMKRKGGDIIWIW
jgi:hypothetical protein